MIHHLTWQSTLPYSIVLLKRRYPNVKCRSDFTRIIDQNDRYSFSTSWYILKDSGDKMFDDFRMPYYVEIVAQKISFS